MKNTTGRQQQKNTDADALERVPQSTGLAVYPSLEWNIGPTVECAPAHMIANS